MLAIGFSILSALAALGGGILAISQKRKIELILGFTAGALLGLVAFDLLPEIFEIASQDLVDIIWPMIALVVGFLLFHTVERFILIHQSHEGDYVIHRHPYVGIASSVALIGHSFLDGMSIGIAFQINDSVGIAVAIAVIGHRFADGFNSVNLMLVNKNSLKQTWRVLAIVAVAPIAGVISTLFYSLPAGALAIYLGFFAGFLLYIGASDILPQAHSKASTYRTIFLTVLGAVFMFAITQLA